MQKPLFRSSRMAVASLVAHAAILGAAAHFGGAPAAAITTVGLLASSAVVKGVSARPAHALNGDIKVFYGWKVFAVNPGAGNDGLLAQGGFFDDAAIADEAYPNEDAQITSMGVAYSKCHQACNLYDEKQDVRGQGWWQSYGAPSTDPVRAQEAADPGVGDPVRCFDIDPPQKEALKAIRLANRTKSASNDNTVNFAKDGEPDLEPPVGG